MIIRAYLASGACLLASNAKGKPSTNAIHASMGIISSKKTQLNAINVLRIVWNAIQTRIVIVLLTQSKSAISALMGIFSIQLHCLVFLVGITNIAFRITACLVMHLVHLVFHQRIPIALDVLVITSWNQLTTNYLSFLQSLANVWTATSGAILALQLIINLVWAAQKASISLWISALLTSAHLGLQRIVMPHATARL